MGRHGIILSVMSLCIANTIDLAAVFGDYHDYRSPCFDRVWSTRPEAIIHTANLKLEEISHGPFFTRTVPDEKLLMSVAEASLAARSLKIPFVLIVPGWGDVPSTPKGMASLLAEDVVVGDQVAIVRVNGLFGPEVSNRVRAMVLGDSPTVDDEKVINPISARSLGVDVRWILTREMFGEVIQIGDKPGTWYEYFAKVHPNVRPWVDTSKQARIEREMGWEYAGEEDYWMPYHASELELRTWLIREGHELLPEKV